MVVFSFYDPAKPLNLVDVFITEPVPYSVLEKGLIWFEGGNVKIPIVSRAHLKQLKEIAGRPQDIADIEMLDALTKERETNDQ